MIKTAFLIMVFMGLGAVYVKAQTTQNPIITLNKEQDLLLVGEQTYFLEDKTGKLTIEDILKPENQQKFQLVGKDVFTHTPSPSKFWFKASIQNLSKKEAWLAVESIYLWHIDYFSPKNGQYILQTQTGALRPEANKAYPSNVFWLPLGASSEIQTVYLSTYTQSVVEAPIRVGTILSLSQEKLKSDYLFGGFVGLMLVMFAYNLFLFFATQDRIYIPYLGYVLTSIFSAAHLNNYPILDLFLGEQYRPLLHLYFYFWVGVPFVFVGYFAIYFLNLKQHPPIFRKSIQFSIFIFAVLVPVANLFTIVPFYIQVIFNQIAAIFSAACLLSISFYLLFVKNERNALFYTLGWVWAILGFLIYLLSINGILPYHLLTRNAIFLGVGLEVLVFSLALADRINRLRIEKNSIYQENLKLIQEQTKLLEQKIAERTEAIKINEALLEKTTQLSRVGAWELDWRNGEIKWSRVTRLIHEVADDYNPNVEKSKVFYDFKGGLEKFNEVAFKCAADGTPLDLEMQIITAKNKPLWVRILGEAEFDKGKCIRLLGTFQDINERKRAEVETQEIKEKLSSVFESISEVVWSVRLPEQKAILITPSAETLFEIPIENLMENYRLWQTVVHPDDQPMIDLIENAFIDKKNYYYEYRIITQSGKLKWLGHRGNLIVNEEKTPIRIDGIISDITKRKLAEIENKQAQEKLSSIFNSISEMVWSISLPNRQTSLVTPSAEAIFELPLEQLKENYKIWETVVHPDDQEVVAKIRQALYTQSSYLYEYRIITKSGKLKWLSHSGKLIFNESNTPIRMDGMISDITQRKQAEEALSEEHKLLRTIIDNLPINIYVKDLLSKKIMVNKSELDYLGVKDEAEIIGKDDFEIYPENSAKLSFEEDKQVLGSGQAIIGLETINTKLNGDKCWFLTSKIPIRNSKGEIHGLVGISYDFTQRKQAEESLQKLVDELRQTQETLEQQAEEITTLNNHLEVLVEQRTQQLTRRNEQLNEYAFFNAHKLRAPIATILGLYQVLELGVSGEEKEMIVEKLRESVVLLDEMVKQSQGLLDEVDDKDNIINPQSDEDLT
jgi:PAS domain S-box-containing protein